MGYWFILILFLIIIGALVTYAIIYHDNKVGKHLPVLLAVVFSLITIPFILDIPFAIQGGKSIKTDTFSKVGNISPLGIQIIYAGDKLLFSYQNYSLDKYEQDKKYQIFYTPFSKSILAITKID